MNRFATVAITAGALTIAALGAAGAATAAPIGVGMSAADTVDALEAQGFAVQINGQVISPLSTCKVTGVHGLAGAMPLSQFDTVYVDVSCPDLNS